MNEIQLPHSEQNLDYSRVLQRVIRNWYWILLCLVVTCTIAYLINRYTPRVYPISMSILIKESQETGGSAELLYNNPLVNPYKNFYNQLYILKSYPLIEEVVRELNFGVFLYKEGNIRTSEVYKSIPVEIRVLNENGSFPSGKSFGFTPLSLTDFVLEDPVDNQEPIVSETFHFGDTVSFRGVKLHVQTLAENLDKFVNEKFKMRFVHPRSLTKSYIGRLNAEWAEEGSSVINLSITRFDP